MKKEKRQWGLLAFVAIGLVLVGLLSLSSSAWATPAQEHAQQQTVINKFPAYRIVNPGDEVDFKLEYTNESRNDWHNVQIVDDIDPRLRIDNVVTTPTADDVQIVGQTITVTYNTVTSGSTVTIFIYCTVRDTASEGDVIPNEACLWIEEDLKDCDNVIIEVEEIEEFIPETGSLLLLGSGLAGLAGYAGLRWRGRSR